MKISGKLIGIPFIARIVSGDSSLDIDKTNAAFYVTGFQVPVGYAAYLVSETIPQEYVENLHNYCPDANIVYELPNDCKLSSNDVIAVDADGNIALLYEDSSEDNVLFITNNCNSNCIMCPDTDYMRKKVSANRMPALMQQIACMPSDPPHLTITGGEPTLLKWDFLKLLANCKDKFTTTEFLMLTNGRTLADAKYREAFVAAMPDNFRLAVPLYGNTAQKHDAITCAPGSFDQTIAGLKVMQHYCDIEIRIVIMRETYSELVAIAQFISRELPYVKSVSLMGMELLGNAAFSKEKLWVPYEETIAYLLDAINILVLHGIEPRIYNYPLCVLPEQLWSVYARSISPYKVEYSKDCDGCSEKEICGGFFRSTLKLADINVYPL